MSKKNYSWHPSTQICESNSYWKSVADNLIIIYDEIIIVTNSAFRNMTNSLPTNVTNTILANSIITVSTNSNEKRVRWFFIFCAWFY